MLRVAGLSAAYGDGPPVITGVDFTAEAGRIVALIGPNGGGKSTLLRAVRGEIALRTGVVEAPRAASVPQSDRSRLDFPVSAYDVALMGAYERTPWYRPIAHGDRVAATGALERVGLADRANALFGTLSGGQRQRVMIARALVQDAPLLLLDEPFAGVDAPSAARIESLLLALRDEGRTILVATHDVNQARRFDRVLCIHGRQIAYGPPADALTAETLQQTYGGELIMLPGGAQAVAVDHHAH